MHGILIEQLPDFRTDAHWTSNNRNQAFPDKPAFTGKEKEHADFTYKDDQGILTRLLMDKGLNNGDELLKNPPTYHLEVKSTKGPCDEPFFMSDNQLKMASPSPPKKKIYSLSIYLSFPRLSPIYLGPPILQHLYRRLRYHAGIQPPATRRRPD